MMRRLGQAVAPWGVLLGIAGILVAGWALALDAQKISELKGAPRESIWEFLGKLPSSFEAQIFYGVAIAAIAGHLASWAWKFFNRQVGCFWDYMFKEHVFRTAAALFATMSLCLTAITAGVFEAPSGEFVGWFNVLWWGAQAGAGVDLAINRGSAAGRK